MVKKYIREDDPYFVSIAIFVYDAKWTKKWSVEKIQSIIKEAQSKDKHHLYKTLMTHMNEEK